MNEVVESSIKEIKKMIMESAQAIPVLKMDDFKMVYVHGTPRSSNSERFSSFSTMANLAVKLHSNDLTPLPLLCQPFIDFNWIHQSVNNMNNSSKAGVTGDCSESYFEQVLSRESFEEKQLYHFRTGTQARTLKNFHVLAALPYKMKTLADMKRLILHAQSFLST
ncbi:hypothetical protein DFS34DRAFT_590979 [Phlyctochytrium arcticum]|nr:hypothetical protein DFS34DRAFT_590979 [Phlyctochytrium arcticum]